MKSPKNPNDNFKKIRTSVDEREVLQTGYAGKKVYASSEQNLKTTTKAAADETAAGDLKPPKPSKTFKPSTTAKTAKTAAAIPDVQPSSSAKKFKLPPGAKAATFKKIRTSVNKKETARTGYAGKKFKVSKARSVKTATVKPVRKTGKNLKTFKLPKSAKVSKLRIRQQRAVSRNFQNLRNSRNSRNFRTNAQASTAATAPRPAPKINTATKIGAKGKTIKTAAAGVGAGILKTANVANKTYGEFGRSLSKSENENVQTVGQLMRVQSKGVNVASKAARKLQTTIDRAAAAKTAKAGAKAAKTSAKAAKAAAKTAKATAKTTAKVAATSAKATAAVATTAATTAAKTTNPVGWAIMLVEIIAIAFVALILLVIMPMFAASGAMQQSMGWLFGESESAVFDGVSHAALIDFEPIENDFRISEYAGFFITSFMDKFPINSELNDERLRFTDNELKGYLLNLYSYTPVENGLPILKDNVTVALRTTTHTEYVSNGTDEDGNDLGSTLHISFTLEVVFTPRLVEVSVNPRDFLEDTEENRDIFDLYDLAVEIINQL